MTVIFTDIHNKMPQDITDNKVTSTTFDEARLADETICISENAHSLTKVLQLIQQEGSKYGLQLNIDKCELI